MKKQERCEKCGGPPGKSINKSLCQECIKSLPQCYGCGIICGAEKWGYKYDKEAIQGLLKKTGKKIFLCEDCGEKIVKNKDLIQDKNRKIPAEEIEIITKEAEIINEGPNQ